MTLTGHQGRESRYSKRLTEAWTAFIGPEYASNLSQIKNGMLYGLPVLLLGFVIGLVLKFPALDYSANMIIGILIVLLSSVPLVMGGIKLIILELRIQRNLESAGFTVKPGGPDLRSIEIFKAWSKRSGITAEDIIRTGRPMVAEDE